MKVGANGVMNKVIIYIYNTNSDFLILYRIKNVFYHCHEFSGISRLLMEQHTEVTRPTGLVILEMDSKNIII